MFKLVCSNKPSGRNHGNAEMFHLTHDNVKTLCGRGCSEWVKMDDMPLQEAVSSSYCCSRCAKKSENIQ